jgi:hypothetical protein
MRTIHAQLIDSKRPFNSNFDVVDLGGEVEEKEARFAVN